MKIDVDALTLPELDALLVAAERRKKLLASRRPVAVVRSALIAFAESHGYAIDALIDAGSPAPAAGRPAKKHKRAKAAVKYRDPDNRRNTWSGRGRMPRWLADKTKRGQSAADFLIPGLGRPTAKKRSSIGQRTVYKQG
ncbi:H-NS histone family protein [Luteimonas sp. XNQY3]|nr:H-NS histone family protein [Luteimonas sp. XNQY3]MCD9006325.1 H-NS histone family protein [Luteimonas sp. XNQY3]